MVRLGTADEALLGSLSKLSEPSWVWQPTLLPGEDPGTAAALTELIATGEVTRAFDTVLEQAEELIETREPRRKLAKAELRERALELVGDPPHRYGTWVHYPWSRRLVHVLPEDAFRELRTSRNRNKITQEEQRRLHGMTVGVLGLSVGAASAVTLAMEEIGGELVLADFDRLSLSNMNRLRAGVHEIGLHKTVLTAREIFELNPYARVRLFTSGINDDNIDEFLASPRLDLLCEECDDLFLKIRIRERARELGIPVLMETSDRGLLDIERFDREPTRALLHGLAGEITADSLRGLSTYQKVPIVLRIIGEQTISPRMAASLVEIDETLKTWPQLASAISLGAALNTDAARRILLGELSASGRFHVDLDSVVSERTAEHIDVVDDSWMRGATPPPSLPVLSRVEGAITKAALRDLVRYGLLAPSGGNCQPWRFSYRDGTLRCLHDVERSRSLLDFEHTASYLAFGALAETLSLTAAEMGLSARITPFPDAAAPELICEIALEPGADDAAREPALFAQLVTRVTNRQLCAREPLPAAEVRALEEVAAAGGARLTLLTADDELKEAGAILGAGDRLRLLSPVMHREMMAEVRWSRAEVETTRDGLDVRSLELDDTDLAGMRVSSSWPVMELVGRFGGGASLEKLAHKSVASASAVGLISMRDARPLDYFLGGRTLQRLWLTVNQRGYALQPMTALLYMFARLLRGHGEGFSDRERAELQELRARHEELFASAPGAGELMLFRLVRASPPRVRALRRHVDDVLTFEEP